MLGMTPSGLRWLADTNRIKSFRAGTLRLIPVSEIMRLRRERERRAAAVK